MKRVLMLILKIVGGVFATIIVLLAIAFGAFHTDAVQDRLVKEATELLSDYLKTSVRIEKASVSFIDQGVRLYGVEIDDQQQRKMFQMKELGVDVNLLRLLRHEIKIKKANISGLEARLYKPASDSDSVANFQFVVEAFKSKKKQQPVDTIPAEEKAKKQKMTLDISKVSLEDIKVCYNDSMQAQLGRLRYKKGKNQEQWAEVRNLETSFVKQTKKGPVDTRVFIDMLDAVEKDGKRYVTIDELHYQTDNHKPRKNAGKPNRGAFDVGHFDVAAHLEIQIDSLGKDTLVAQVLNGRAQERGCGLVVTELTLKVNGNKRQAHVSDLSVKLPNTSLSIASADIQLPSKKEQRPLAFSTSQIKGRVLLKDIAKTFAPVLRNFSIPLNLQTRMSGNDNELRFSGVSVSTTDRKLTISAAGRISNLKDKYKLLVHFDVNRMTTDGVYAERVINQFPVKKFMMKQLHNLGRIGYHGHFDVLWKKEQFAGQLTTVPGKLNFNLALDELNKYVYGTARTDSFLLGKAMDYPDLGKIACKADFRFDISKPRTAQMRKQKGGKLPIGSVKAEVAEAKYKKLTVRNVFATIESDGAVATGNINIKGSRVDVLGSFTFTNTNEMKKTTFKPGIRFHKMSEEDKAKRDEQRAAKKEAKQQAREERRAARAEERAQKAEEKAERKAQKAEEKAARKAAKAEAKAARKAAKEAAKQAAATSEE